MGLFGGSKSGGIVSVGRSISDGNGPRMNKTAEWLIEQGSVTLADITSAPMMSFQREYMQIGPETFCSVLAVAHWPTDVTLGWFDKLLYLEHCKVDISMHIHPVEKEYIEGYLRSKLGNVESTIELESRKGKESGQGLTQQQQDILLMKDMVVVQRENFYQMSLLINVYGDSVADLASNVTTTAQILRSRGMEAKPIWTRQREAIGSVMPWGKDLVKTYHNFYTSALATSFPFTVGTLNEGNVCYGVNPNNLSPHFWNVYDDPDSKGFNMLIAGVIGSGKSFYTKTLAGRYALTGVDIFAIDPSPQPEYRNFAKGYGGTIIDISPTSQSYINPFDIAQVAERLSGSQSMQQSGEELTGDQIMSTKSQYLSALLELMGDGLIGKPELNILDTILLKWIYESKGIDFNKPETWANEAPTMGEFSTMLAMLEKIAEIGFDQSPKILRSAEKPGQPPIVAFTAAKYHRDMYSEKIKFSEREMECIGRLREGISQYVNGSKAWLFSGTHRVKADSQVVVFELGNCPETMRDLAMFVVFGEIYNRMLLSGSKKRKIAIVDEAWKLMENENAGHFLQSLLREGRKMGLGVWILSQGVTDFSNTPAGRQALNLTSARVLLSLSAAEAAEARDKFKFSAAVELSIPKFSKGQGVLILTNKDRVVNFYMEPTPRELVVADTSETSMSLSDFEEE